MNMFSPVAVPPLNDSYDDHSRDNMHDIDDGPQIYSVDSKDNPISGPSSTHSNNSVNLGNGVFLEDAEHMFSSDAKKSQSNPNSGSPQPHSSHSNTLNFDGVNGSALPNNSIDSFGERERSDSESQGSTIASYSGSQDSNLTINVNATNNSAASSSPSPPSPVAAANKLIGALSKLRQVDVILDQLGYFWARTELVLDAITKKGQHVEQFVGYAKNPRLLARFKERIEEYKRFWEGISIMCSNYVSGVEMSDGISHNPVSMDGAPRSPGF